MVHVCVESHALQVKLGSKSGLEKTHKSFHQGVTPHPNPYKDG